MQFRMDDFTRDVLWRVISRCLKFTFHSDSTRFDRTVLEGVIIVNIIARMVTYICACTI